MSRYYKVHSTRVQEASYPYSSPMTPTRTSTSGELSEVEVFHHTVGTSIHVDSVDISFLGSPGKSVNDVLKLTDKIAKAVKQLAWDMRYDRMMTSLQEVLESTKEKDYAL